MGPEKDKPVSTKTAIVSLSNDGVTQQMVPEKVNRSHKIASKHLKFNLKIFFFK